jgi:ribulose kinase
VKADSVQGIGFDATCSLAVFSVDRDEPVSVTGPGFDNGDGNDCNVILWLDHRPDEETKKINATKHNLLRYVGGSMSIEMEGDDNQSHIIQELTIYSPESALAEEQYA